MEVSISSLRADSLTEELVASLQRGGHRTLTMAPEAGTERLRAVVRKVITDEQIYAACDLLRKYGIPNLKCYFMIGQPTETMEDVEAIPDLARRMLERLRVPGPDGHPFGKLTLSVSSFVPKPWTPFQWAPFDEPRDLEAKLEAIKSAARRIQVRVVHENPREAGLQALLARGRSPRRGLPRDRRAARRRLAPGAPRMERRSRLLHPARARARRDHAVGPFRRGREEGGPAAGMAARGAGRGGDRHEPPRPCRGGRRRSGGRRASGGRRGQDPRPLQRGRRLLCARQRVLPPRRAARRGGARGHHGGVPVACLALGCERPAPTPTIPR